MGKRLSKKQIWIFAVGQLGWSILGGIVNTWLVTFYLPTATDIANGAIQYIQPGYIFWVLTILGIITAASRLFDAVTDPLIASLSDRCKSKRGRRIPFMQWSAVPFAAITILLFCTPDKFISGGNVAWIAVFIILFYLFMTMYCTPYNALISEFGKTQEDRMAISTAISLTFFVGTLLAYVPFVLQAPIQSAMSNLEDAFAWGYRIPFIVLAVIALVAMLLPTFLLKEKEFVDTEPSKSNMFKSLASTFKNKDFRVFVGSDIMYWIGLTLFQTGLPFFVKVSMGLDQMMVMVLMGTMTVLSAAIYPFVTKLVKKFGKKKLVIIGFLGLSIAYVIAGLTNLPGIADIPAMGYIFGFLICIVAAFPMALLGIIPQSIVADIAEAEAVTTGENREGMFFAARTFSMKLGQSIAMLAFTSLAIIGAVQDSSSNDIVATTLGLGIVAIVAIVFCVLGAVILFFYREKKVMKLIAKDSDAEFLAAVEKESAFDKFSKEEGESAEPALEQKEPIEEVSEEPEETVEEPAPEEDKPEE
ncbi:MAG: MFS transporter [Clostridia bacterium]|nr:MFS transporter [Clostridia bacterium]